MAKLFIEVTNSESKLKRAISVDRITSVIEEPDGTAFIEFYEPFGKKPTGIYVSESYTDIFNTLVEMELL